MSVDHHYVVVSKWEITKERGGEAKRSCNEANETYFVSAIIKLCCNTR